MKRGALALVALLLAACHGDGRQIAVTDGAGAAFESALAAQGNELLLAWHDDRTNVDQIYLRRYDTGLSPLSAELQLTQGRTPSYEADVVFLQDHAAVAWYEATPDGRANVHVALWDTASGRELWRHTLGDGARARIPVLATNSEHLFMAWIEDQDLKPATPPRPSTIWQAWLRADGTLFSPPAPLATASPSTWNLNAAMFDSRTAAVVYDSGHATEQHELYLTLAHPQASSEDAQPLRRNDGIPSTSPDTDARPLSRDDGISSTDTNALPLSRNDGTPSTYPDTDTWRLSRDDGIPSTYPDLAVNGDTLALTWFDTVENNSDVYLRLFQKPLLGDTTDSLDLDVEAQAITQTPGASIGAYLAWCEDILGLALIDDSSGTQHLFLQLFDQSGSALGPLEQLTHNRTDSTIPAIKAADNSFLLSWSEANLNGHDTRRSTLMLRRVPLR